MSKFITSCLLLGCLTLLGAQRGQQAIMTDTGAASPWIGCGVPVSAWAMNEGSGLTLHDSSGNSNTATISGSGAVTWQTNGTLPGTTTLFTGSGNATSSNVSLTNFDGTTPFSVTLWIVGASGGSVEAYLGNAKTGPSNQGWVLFNNTEQLEFALINNNAGSASLIDYEQSNVLPATGTHFIGSTYDPSQSVGSQVKLYVDGTAVPATYKTDNLSGSTASGLVVNMGNSDITSWPLTHAMAFDEIFPCVQTPAEMAAMYALGPGIH